MHAENRKELALAISRKCRVANSLEGRTDGQTDRQTNNLIE